MCNPSPSNPISITGQLWKEQTLTPKQDLLHQIRELESNSATGSGLVEIPTGGQVSYLWFMLESDLGVSHLSFLG